MSCYFSQYVTYIYGRHILGFTLVICVFCIVLYMCLSTCSCLYICQYHLNNQNHLLQFYATCCRGPIYSVTWCRESHTRSVFTVEARHWQIQLWCHSSHPCLAMEKNILALVTLVLFLSSCVIQTAGKCTENVTFTVQVSIRIIQA